MCDGQREPALPPNDAVQLPAGLRPKPPGRHACIVCRDLE
jgi:hypothetical protein